MDGVLWVLLYMGMDEAQVLLFGREGFFGGGYLLLVIFNCIV